MAFYSLLCQTEKQRLLQHSSCDQIHLYSWSYPGNPLPVSEEIRCRLSEEIILPMYQVTVPWEGHYNGSSEQRTTGINIQRQGPIAHIVWESITSVTSKRRLRLRVMTRYFCRQNYSIRSLLTKCVGKLLTNAVAHIVLWYKYRSTDAKCRNIIYVIFYEISTIICYANVPFQLIQSMKWNIT